MGSWRWQYGPLGPNVFQICFTDAEEHHFVHFPTNVCSSRTSHFKGPSKYQSFPVKEHES